MLVEQTMTCRSATWSDRRLQAAGFAVIAFGLAMALAFSGAPTILYMFTPTFAVLAMLAFSGEMRDLSSWRSLGLRFRGRRAALVAIAIPSTVLVTGYLVASSLGVTALALPAEISGGQFVVTWAILIPIATLEAMGEEIGWRGYLLPRVMPDGRTQAAIVMGLVWAVWHYPLILLTTSYHAGFDPIWLVLFTLACVPMSAICNELRLRSDSTWSAAIFHGAHNVAFAQMGLLATAGGSLDRIAGETGLVPLILYGAIAIAILAGGRFGRPARTE